MKIVIVASFLFLASGMPLPKATVALHNGTPAARQSTNAEKQNAYSNNVSSVNMTEVSLQDNQAAAREEKQEQAREERQDSFNHWILGIGILQGIALFLTAYVIWQQTVAAKNSERPWMVAQMENLPELTENNLPGQAASVLRMACHIKNMGRTPAILYSKAERKEVADKLYELPSQPPAYENIVKWQKGALLPPGAEIVVIFYLYQDETRPVYDGNKTLWIHGFIEYKDAFGYSHVAQYCFKYYPRLGGKDPATVGFYPDGPPKYNEAT
jgi:hypothetical protein